MTACYLNFDRLDTFTIHDNINIGDLTAVKIRRDETGWFPRWQLDKVDTGLPNHK
jgi:hypothetical protein